MAEESREVILTDHGMVVYPYKARQNRQLENQNSVSDQVYHKRVEVTGFVLPYKKGTAYLTHSYQAQYAQDLFPGYQVFQQRRFAPYRLNDPIHPFDEITPTEVQQSLITQITSDIQSKSESAWFLQLQTGYGKTVISVILSSMIGYRTFILADSNAIKEQWVDTFYTKTDLADKRILELKGSAQLDRILKDPKKFNSYDILIGTPSLITSFGKSRGYDQVTKLFKILGIGFLVIDEAHRNIGNTVRLLATTSVAYNLFLSADFGQADNKKEQLFFQIFKNVKHLVPDEKYRVSMKYTEAVIMEYNTKPTEIESQSVFGRYGYSAQKYVDYQMKKGTMMECIEYILDTFSSTQKGMAEGFKTAILFPNVAHVDAAYELLLKRYGDRYTVARYHGQISEEERQWAKQCGEIIVSTYKGFSTGIDVTDIKYMIGTNQSNKIEDNQTAGRARPLRDGSKAMYFIMIDKGFSYCKKKLRSRINYLQETKLSGLHKVKFYGNNESIL